MACFREPSQPCGSGSARSFIACVLLSVSLYAANLRTIPTSIWGSGSSSCIYAAYGSPPRLSILRRHRRARRFSDAGRPTLLLVPSQICRLIPKIYYRWHCHDIDTLHLSLNSIRGEGTVISTSGF